jgi:nitroimidazol reductase NimA-like FMN-containing flavoprotein (pyridoxamine 5'-phosphate oxidase superfamily)
MAVEDGMPEHPTDHAGLEMLPFDECLRLLASVPLGRVGFYADGEVVVLPVNHVIDGQDVVFRTARGAKLSAAEAQNPVAFEADYYDPEARSGWSVLVNGHAEAVLSYCCTTMVLWQSARSAPSRSRPILTPKSPPRPKPRE